MHYLLAKTVRDAHNTARIDWNWRQLGAMDYEDNNGDKVKILSRVEQLVGLPQGTKVYKGYRYNDRPERENYLLREFVDSGRVILIEHAAPR